MAATIVQPKPEPGEAPPKQPRKKPQRTLDAVIRRAVLRELRRQEGNLTRTARELAISRQTLLNYLDAWGLRIERNGKVWRLLPRELRQERALGRRFSHRTNHSRYEDACQFERRRHLEEQRGAMSELDVIRETMIYAQGGER
jgi:hypothetical protein